MASKTEYLPSRARTCLLLAALFVVLCTSNGQATQILMATLTPSGESAALTANCEPTILGGEIEGRRDARGLRTIELAYAGQAKDFCLNVEYAGGQGDDSTRLHAVADRPKDNLAFGGPKHEESEGFLPFEFNVQERRSNPISQTEEVLNSVATNAANDADVAVAEVQGEMRSPNAMAIGLAVVLCLGQVSWWSWRRVRAAKAN